MSVLGIEAVKKYFETAKPRYEKGKDAVESGHLMECGVDRDIGVLFGTAQASQKTTSYKAKAFFTKSKISHAECSCPIGEHGLCHHIAALLYYASQNVSCTDTKCQWVFKAKAGHGNEGSPIDALYPSFKSDYRAIPGTLSSEEVKEARRKLASCKGAAAAIKWFTDPEPTTSLQSTGCDSDGVVGDEFKVPLVEDAVNSVDYHNCDDKLQFFREKLNLSWSDIECIAEATKDQNLSPVWHAARRYRLTGSNFGKAIRASKSNRSCASLFSAMSGLSKSLEGVHAIQWGNNHEETAVKEFCAMFPDKVVKKTGIWLDQYGILGASPDRLCSDDALIEVKCPYSLRNSCSLEEALKEKKFQKYFITYDQQNNCIVNPDHDYFHQVQGQLHQTNRRLCYCLIWCPKDMLTVPIERDPAWADKYLPAIYKFYIDRYLPHAFP